MQMFINPVLLWMLKTELNCSTSDIVSTLNLYHKQCIDCPPNITRRFKDNIDFKCWVLRGFYPGTNIVFRMTTAHSEGNGFLIKVVLPDSKTLGSMRTFTKYDIDNMANDVLLGSTTEYKKLHTPKLMTPKGMKPLKWRKK